MEDRLKPCPFCEKIDSVGVFLYREIEDLDDWDDEDYSAVCCNAQTGGCGAIGGYGETKDIAAELWNRRAPLYTPVKPEDITEGWYWHKPTADDDAEIVYIRCEDGTFGMDTQDRFITVLELYMWGGVLFRIPELPDLEAQE